MKLIGVLGGMSWESTAQYFRLLNTGVRDWLSGLHSARLRVATVDFATIASLQAAGDWPGAGEVLAPEARELRAAGTAPLYVGSPGYAAKLDRDGDGVACEG